MYVCVCVCVSVLPSEELDKFMESQGASGPGILTLTTSLSRPFMRLDKYPTLLQELERHVEVKPQGSPSLLRACTLPRHVAMSAVPLEAWEL